MTIQHHPHPAPPRTIILAGERVKNTGGALGFMSGLESLTRNFPLIEIEDRWEAALAARRMHGFFEQLNNRFLTRKAQNGNDYLCDRDLLLRVEDSSLPRDAYERQVQAQENIYQAITHDCPELNVTRSRLFTSNSEALDNLCSILPESQRTRIHVLICLRNIVNTISTHLPQMKPNIAYDIGY